MQRRLLLILVLLLLPAQSWAADDCFNFRATAGYVTDAADTSPVLGEIYPNSYSNGLTGGWDAAIDTRDRSTTVPRLAGGNQQIATTTLRTFRVDLPATGTYTIRLGMGDATQGDVRNRYLIQDNTTTLFEVTDSGTIAADSFFNANDTAATAANWVTNYTSSGKNYVFASTIFKFQIAAFNGLTRGSIAHLCISSSGGETFGFRRRGGP